jgi:hypothetical protein
VRDGLRVALFLQLSIVAPERATLLEGEQDCARLCRVLAECLAEPPDE